MVKHEKCFIDDITVDIYNKTYAAMHPTRRAKIDRLRHEDDKKRSLAGEYLARTLVSDMSGIPFEEIVIVADQKGKPKPENIPLEFNISHSENIVVAALHKDKVGIDVEKIHAVRPKLFKKVCTDKELEYLFGRIPDDGDYEREASYQELSRFFEIWTIKEAYFKCIGTGITDFKSIDIFSESIRVENFSFDDYVIHAVTLK